MDNWSGDTVVKQSHILTGVSDIQVKVEAIKNVFITGLVQHGTMPRQSADHNSHHGHIQISKIFQGAKDRCLVRSSEFPIDMALNVNNGSDLDIFQLG